MSQEANNILPQYFARPDDACVFSLNEDGLTYSTYEGKKKFPDSWHHQYSYDVLISHDFYPVTEEDFPALEKKRQEYVAFTVWQNRSDGHGGIKGGTMEEYLNLKK